MMRATRLLLATLVLGTLMTVLASLPVSAGGGSPTLSADHNPVIVPLGQTTGKVTLTWDAGKGSGVEFWDSINGGVEIGPFPQPVSGMDTDTLTVGETVTYRMYSPGKAQLLDTLTVKAQHPNPADYFCELNPCITNVNVTQGYTDDGSGAYGFSMDITWTTSKDAGAIIAVSKQAEISDVDGNEFAHVDGAALQFERTGPKHSVRISHLQSSSYHFIIEAIDTNGNKTKYHGLYHFYAYL